MDWIVHIFQQCMTHTLNCQNRAVRIRPIENESSTLVQIGQNIEYHENKIRMLDELKNKIHSYTVLSTDDIRYIQKMDKLYLLEIIYAFNHAVREKDEHDKWDTLFHEENDVPSSESDKLYLFV